VEGRNELGSKWSGVFRPSSGNDAGFGFAVEDDLGTISEICKTSERMSATSNDAPKVRKCSQLTVEARLLPNKILASRIVARIVKNVYSVSEKNSLRLATFSRQVLCVATSCV
jgi:hypothetical protein